MNCARTVYAFVTFVCGLVAPQIPFMVAVVLIYFTLSLGLPVSELPAWVHNAYRCVFMVRDPAGDLPLNCSAAAPAAMSYAAFTLVSRICRLVVVRHVHGGAVGSYVSCLGGAVAVAHVPNSTLCGVTSAGWC